MGALSSLRENERRRTLSESPVEPNCRQARTLKNLLCVVRFPELLAPDLSMSLLQQEVYP